MAPDTGEKKGKYMKKKQNRIIEGTFGKMRRIDDFLPAPEELALKENKKVKVTMSLDKTSVDFFKQQAKKFGSSYQFMIRNLLSQYVARHF